MGVPTKNCVRKNVSNLERKNTLGAGQKFNYRSGTPQRENQEDNNKKEGTNFERTWKGFRMVSDGA